MCAIQPIADAGRHRYVVIWRVIGGLGVTVLLVACGSIATGPEAGRGSIAALSSIAASSTAPGWGSAEVPASAPPASSGAPASAPPLSSPFPAGSELGLPAAEFASYAYVLYAQHGVVLVGVAHDCCGSQEAKPSTLWLSIDMTHWRDVTPPGSRELVNPDYFPGLYASFDEASFLNPSTGWVTTWNGGNLGVTAYRTSDGGKTWSSVVIGGHGDHAGDAYWIQLVTPKIAFTEGVAATGPGMSLNVTTDEGRSWRTVYGWPTATTDSALASGPFELPVAFVSSSRGFAATGIPPAEFDVNGDFFITNDGGVAWSRVIPPSIKSAACPTDQTEPVTVQCLVSVPRFTDSTNGVLATEVIDGATARIGFDVTRDAGSSWQLAGRVDVSVPVFPRDSYPMTNYAFVGTPSTTTWWIASYDPQGLTSRVTSDGGMRWSAVTATGFDGTPTAVNAIDATHALLTTNVIGANGATSLVYLTADAGRSWQRLFAP